MGQLSGSILWLWWAWTVSWGWRAWGVRSGGGVMCQEVKDSPVGSVLWQGVRVSNRRCQHGARTAEAINKYHAGTISGDKVLGEQRRHGPWRKLTLHDWCGLVIIPETPVVTGDLWSTWRASLSTIQCSLYYELSDLYLLGDSLGTTDRGMRTYTEKTIQYFQRLFGKILVLMGVFNVMVKRWSTHPWWYQNTRNMVSIHLVSDNIHGRIKISIPPWDIALICVVLLSHIKHCLGSTLGGTKDIPVMVFIRHIGSKTRFTFLKLQTMVCKWHICVMSESAISMVVSVYAIKLEDTHTSPTQMAYFKHF